MFIGVKLKAEKEIVPKKWVNSKMSIIIRSSRAFPSQNKLSLVKFNNCKYRESKYLLKSLKNRF